MPAPCRKATVGCVASNGLPPVAAYARFRATVRSIALLRRPESRLLRGAEGLVQVVDDVVGVLEADGEADRVLADPGRLQRRRIELLVRRARGMDDERLRVA